MKTSLSNGFPCEKAVLTSSDFGVQFNDEHTDKKNLVASLELLVTHFGVSGDSPRNPSELIWLWEQMSHHLASSLSVPIAWRGMVC